MPVRVDLHEVDAAVLVHGNVLVECDRSVGQRNWRAGIEDLLNVTDWHSVQHRGSAGPLKGLVVARRDRVVSQLRREELVVLATGDEGRFVLDSGVRIGSVQAVHFCDQWIEADRAQSIPEGSPARLNPAAATHVQKEQRAITPQAPLEYTTRQRTATLAHALPPAGARRATGCA